MAKLNIAILTVYTEDYKPLADIVIPNLQRYCLKHDYDLYDFKIDHSGVYYGYQKLEKLLAILKEENIDAVLCIDLDVLITNHNIKIESFLDSEHDFYITKDVNGINAGSFIIKSSEWSIKFLRTILHNTSKFECEQNAFEYFNNLPEHKDKIKVLEHPSINSYMYAEYGPTWGIIVDKKIDKPLHKEGNWEIGDFILHLPGITFERRLEIFKSLEKEIIL
jgi:hypothetical protein